MVPCSFPKFWGSDLQRSLRTVFAVEEVSGNKESTLKVLRLGFDPRAPDTVLKNLVLSIFLWCDVCSLPTHQSFTEGNFTLGYSPGATIPFSLSPRCPDPGLHKRVSR